MQPMRFDVRPARPADIPSLFRMKLQLVISEKAESGFRATEQDWLRDAFGTNPKFMAIVAEHEGAVVGMVTYSERYSTGWAGPTYYVQDLFVEPIHRKRAVGTALLAEVAAQAVHRAIPLVELTVRNENVARKFYRRCGFQRIRHCPSYVLVGQSLANLTARSATGDHPVRLAAASSAASPFRSRAGQQS
ncbi:MAG: hypothetical protein QOF19_2589 [Alphaproteobacteria bacterium]|jgi:ribosomal protein S18 acetylase RimI-like enzyme|nr:hypothetical protein [Alphaproteobacteria bacterium]